MDFSPTETQVLLGDMVTGLLQAEYGFEARRRRLAAGDGLWPKLAELGLLGVEIEEAHGGSGGGFEDLAAVMGPFGRFLVVEPYLATVVLGAGMISAAGSPAQKSAILPGVVAGEVKLALAHAERRARQSTAWVAARATRTAAGWRLEGEKAVVLGGDVASSFVVSARTGGEGDDPAGVSLFLVASHAPGLSVRPYPLYDASGAADVVLEGVEIGADALLGAEGAGLAEVELAYDRGRAALAAEAVGAMAQLCEITRDYLNTRVQFGQPIGKFQALQHRMVDAHVEVELARSMALLAADAAGETDPQRRARPIAAAKAQIGRAARTVGQSCVQLHGGIALTEEYAAGHYFKRLTMIERLFGDVAESTRRFAALAA